MAKSTPKPRRGAHRAGTTRRAQPATRSILRQRQDLNIVVDLIPRTNSNRPGTPLHPSKITIHNTDNAEPGADAQAHCRYQKGADAQRRQVSWHFTVDDGNIYQSLLVDEVGWHAGSHAGNSCSIGIEICEHQGIDQVAANSRAAQLTALMLHELAIDLEGNVVQHNSWSGKDCPALLRNPPNGWKKFLEEVAQFYRKTNVDKQDENEHGAPVHEADGSRGVVSVQTNILSTEFGGGNEAGMPSAYGGTIDPNRAQASLPARVARSRRQIRVTNSNNNRSVTCFVNDVGPWNMHDTYWDQGIRPAAEAQYQSGEPAENGQVPTNDAGLDLTPAAMLALGVSGAINTRQVKVDWQFA
jgi:hypothetical protein